MNLVSSVIGEANRPLIGKFDLKALSDAEKANSIIKKLNNEGADVK